MKMKLYDFQKNRVEEFNLTKLPCKLPEIEGKLLLFKLSDLQTLFWKVSINIKDSKSRANLAVRNHLYKYYHIL